MIKQSTKDNPKLHERAINGGKKALYLEYYLGRTSTPKTDESGNQMYYTTGKMAGKPMYLVHHSRKKEELRLYLFSKPKDEAERTHNANTLLQAKQIRNTRELEMLSGVMGYSVMQKATNIIPLLESYLDTYTKKDIRNIKHAINRFKDYLRQYYPLCAVRRTEAEIATINKAWEDRRGRAFGKHVINPNEHYRFSLDPRQFNEKMIQGFVAFLQESSTGSGAATTFARFKKIVKAIAKEGKIAANPCADIVCKGNGCATKDILSPEEIVKLQQTHLNGENPIIRRAFLFTLYTGVRWCDVVDMRYSNIDYHNKLLRFEQAKTKGHSARSTVEMPINDNILKIVGSPEEQGKANNDLIFDLPSHTMCLKALRHWTAKAGIDKHITWHSGRHTFATIILENGANIKVVADLLGHSGLAYVERYVRAIDESKKRALNSLPELFYES